MFITIYTSRVVLKTLGVEDYGIYNLVGGVVALFSSLKGVFSSAIQRYLNYTRGLGDEEGVRHIFSLSILIQVILALVFFVLVEFFGQFFIPHKLVIPNDMMNVAMFVFHCSIISAVINILSVPYEAVIIANEKMNYYAYISIAEAIMKLAVVFLLPVLPFVTLKSYAVLLLAIHILVVIINVIYCRQFCECKIERYWSKDLFKQLASFSGWSFLGNMIYSLIHEGTNIILNMFAGVVANAARGIATQVRSAISLLSGNLYTASKPFIMQQAATVEKQNLFNYIYILSRSIFYVILVTTIPMVVYTNQILAIWLVEIPKYTISFVRVILVFELIRALHSPIVMLFFSFGTLKRFQITECVVGLLTLPLVYLFLTLGFPLYTAFVAMIIVEVLNLTAIIIVAQKELDFKWNEYIRNVVLKCLFPSIAVVLIASIFYIFTHDADKVVALLWLVLLTFFEIAVVYFVGLHDREKELLRNIFAKGRKLRSK